MPGVERKGDIASCGDANTGSTTVKANGKGITRVKADSAGATILGPGSPTVFVEGYKVSLPGDLIATHGPKGSHAAETTGNESPDVFCGYGGESKPDIDLSLDTIGFGGPYYTNTKNPPGPLTQNCWWYTGDITFSYTVTNNSSVPVGPFNIGLWEMYWNTSIGQTFYWLRGDDGKYDGTWPILRGEVRQGVIPAGAQVTGTLVLPSDPQTDHWGWPPHDLGLLTPNWQITNATHWRGFTMNADIDQEVGETDEKNSVPVIKVGAIYDANGCT